MEQPTPPPNRLPARAAAAFLLLLLLLIVVFAFARRGSLRERQQARWGDLNRRAGNTYVHVGTLTLGAGLSRPWANSFLEAALENYELSLGADPDDLRTVMSQALVLQALDRNKEARKVVAGALARTRREQDRVSLRALLRGPLAAHPTVRNLEAGWQAARDLTPAALVHSDAYEAAGQVATAQQIWNRGLAQARRLVPTLVAVTIICGLILAAGLGALFALALSPLLRRRQGRPAPEHAPPPAEWSGRQALQGLALFVLLQVALGALVAALHTSQKADFYLTLSASGLAGGLTLGWMKLSAGPSADLGWRLLRPRRLVLLGLGAGGAAVLPARFLAQATQTVFHLPPEQHALVPIFTAATDLPARVFLILSACVIIPVIEETIFRGLLFGALRRSLRPGLAALASAVVFATGHLTLTNFLGLTLLGVLFAWLYERTGSLLAPVVAHGVFNAFSVAVLILIYR